MGSSDRAPPLIPGAAGREPGSPWNSFALPGSVPDPLPHKAEGVAGLRRRAFRREGAGSPERHAGLFTAVYGVSRHPLTN